MKHLKKLTIGLVALIFCVMPIIANSTVYTVKKGDTLYSIARKYDVSVNDILNINNMGSNSSIYAGQNILISVKEDESATKKEAQSNDKESTKKSVTPQLYTVQKGDTLFAISIQYETNVSDLRELNKLDEDSAIYVGQILKIPTDTEFSIANADKATSIESLKETPTKKIKKYVVKSGDTLYSIAKVNNTKVATLRSLNKLTKDSVLKVGQTLIVSSTLPTSTLSEVADPRKYEKKKGDISLIWPVKAKAIAYVTGKISGVAITGSEPAEPVTSIREGVVMYSGNYRGYGDVVFIKSTDNYIYMYSGLSSLSVEKGENVKYRTEIGKAGTDAYSGNPVINLMVYKNDNPCDPAEVPRG
ncbi:MAG: hypothetical protein BKP49_10940 [Treponema sp. CETP13]|nr:MAG: hypothetical protein BKP49_10940 [Treponema sp. CETP13]